MIRVLHEVACPIIFILFDDNDWLGEVLKLMKNYHILVFLVVWVLFPKFFKLELHKIKRMSHVVAFPFAFILFYDRYLQEGVLKPVKSCHIFSIFSSFCPFPQDFGQVNDWSLLEVHELTRVLLWLRVQMFFFCFMVGISREEYSKLWKMIIF